MCVRLCAMRVELREAKKRRYIFYARNQRNTKDILTNVCIYKTQVKNATNDIVLG